MKALEALRWVIIAPEAEVKKWTTAIHAKNPSINLEVGPKVANPERWIFCSFGTILRAV